MAIEKQITGDLGESWVRRVGARVPFGRSCRKKGRENVEPVSTGSLCERFGSEKGVVQGSLRGPVPEWRMHT